MLNFIDLWSAICRRLLQIIDYEFTRGTWTQAFEENHNHLRHLNRSLNNKVFFAGEINDPYRQMGVPGAILSGYYSIDELL